jgi:dienelactone hydrolase
MELEYAAGGEVRVGHLATPALPGRAPGVLVLHGGGGLGEHARERADMLADKGYVAFAPDLFGHTVQGVEPAKALTAKLVADWQDLRARCLAGLEVLRGRPETDPGRIAVIGFCFGGQAALELARTGEDIAAVVAFHAQLQTFRPQDSVKISGSVLVCLGDRDCFVFREERETFLENMTESGVDCQMLLFSGVGHSFSDRHAQASGIPGLKYNARADRRSWLAMLDLFRETLHSPDRESK